MFNIRTIYFLFKKLSFYKSNKKCWSWGRKWKKNPRIINHTFYRTYPYLDRTVKKF